MATAIEFQKILPPTALKGLVDYYWFFEGDFSKDNYYLQPTAASIFPKLSFQYEGMMTLVDQTSQIELNIQSGLQAQTNQFQKIVSNQKVGVVGVSFFPHAVPLLLNIPAGEITNSNLEISDVIGTEGKQLEEMIINSKDNTSRIQILTRFLLRKASLLNKSSMLFSSAVHYLYQSPGKTSINQVASNFCLSQRQFQRKFKDQTGFTPKMFSRIARFENCLLKGFDNKKSLTAIAHYGGYYDQSHFIKEFKDFTGNNPTEYFSHDLTIFSPE